MTVQDDDTDSTGAWFFSSFLLINTNTYILVLLGFLCLLYHLCVYILEKIQGFKQNTYSNNLTGINGGNQYLQIFFKILMKTKIRGLDLKLHLLSLKYSVLNVTTCTYQIQITVTLLQLVPVHVRVAEGQET